MQRRLVRRQIGFAVSLGRFRQLRLVHGYGNAFSVEGCRCHGHAGAVEELGLARELKSKTLREGDGLVGVALHQARGSQASGGGAAEAGVAGNDDGAADLDFALLGPAVVVLEGARKEARAATGLLHRRGEGPEDVGVVLALALKHLERLALWQRRNAPHIPRQRVPEAAVAAREHRDGGFSLELPAHTEERVAALFQGHGQDGVALYRVGFD
mmetsp:Transcript_26803/g.83989  ORF Transcript_26803/g.83989 Transcript_26803/m.83989 type:complete len:213 (-) Transcript_26803:334-972(-)